MSYEELVESRKHIGDMTKEELFTYCQGLLDEVWDFETQLDFCYSLESALTSENERLKTRISKQRQANKKLQKKYDLVQSIIKEVREYIKLYCNTDLVLFTEILEILDKVGDEK